MAYYIILNIIDTRHEEVLLKKKAAQAYCDIVNTLYAGQIKRSGGICYWWTGGSERGFRGFGW